MAGNLVIPFQGDGFVSATARQVVDMYGTELPMTISTTTVDFDALTVAGVAVTGGAAANSFSTIAVSGQSNVVADAAADTLTVAAGTQIAITTDATTDTMTIATTGLVIGTNIQAWGSGLDNIKTTSVSLAQINGLDKLFSGISEASKAVVLDSAKDFFFDSGAAIAFQTGSALTVDTGATLTVTGTVVGATGAELNYVDTSAQVDAIAQGGVVSVALANTKLSSTAAGAITLAAPSAAMYGRNKTIEMIAAAGAVTLALTNVQGGTAATTATFTNVNDTLLLVGGTNKWHVVGQSGVALS